MASLTDITEAIIDLEKRFASLRTLIGTLTGKPDSSEKPKKPRAENAWITFNKRVDDLLTENNCGFNSVGDSKKFAAHLKEKQSYTWEDSDILNERQAWEKAHPPSCIICHEDPTGNIKDHRTCIIDYTRDLMEKGKKGTNPVETWMRVSGIKVVKPEKGENVEKAEKAEKVSRPVGRPPMSAEEKAAKKAERQAASVAKKKAELAKPMFQIDSDVLLEDLDSVVSGVAL